MLSIEYISNTVGTVRKPRASNLYFTVWWSGMASPRTDVYSTLVTGDVAIKSPVIKSDGVMPTAYSRAGATILSDIPLVKREERLDGRGGLDLWAETRVPLSGHTNLDSVGLPDVAFDDMSNATSGAYLKAAQKVNEEIYSSDPNDKSSATQLGVDVAEIRKTADMLAKDSRRLLLAWSAARKGLFGLACHHLGVTPRTLFTGKTAAQVWLELIYGWKPLVDSIHDTTQAICDQLNGRRKTGVERKVVATKAFSRSFGDESSSGSWVISGSSRVTYVFAIKSDLFDLANRLGLVNPASIIWELTPFSFVVDWFTPIGQMFDAFSADIGHEYHRGWVTTKYEALFTKSDSGPTLSGSTIQEGFIKLGFTGMSRYVSPGFHTGDIYVKPSPFSSTHITSAAALYRQCRIT